MKKVKNCVWSHFPLHKPPDLQNNIAISIVLKAKKPETTIRNGAIQLSRLRILLDMRYGDSSPEY